jgi:lipoprotein-anchoring transpeptidase ErfK/SrfK
LRTALAAAAALLTLFAASLPAALEDRFRDPRLLRLWQGWVDETIEESRRSGRAAVIVDKLGRRCLLVSAGRTVERYTVELGRNGLSDKLYEGDRATPEGRYRVTSKRGRGQTRFYVALMLDYPTDEDRREHAEGLRRGLVPRGRGPGGLIEIHGHGGSGTDWTDGCVALRNEDMDRLFAAVEVGTPVTIAGTARFPGDPP